MICGHCHHPITDVGELLRLTDGETEVVLHVGCAAALAANTRDRDPGEVAAADQRAAGMPGVLVDPAELAACRTAADVDALVERVERERRMVEELEP
jgi:hypothetical protein